MLEEAIKMTKWFENCDMIGELWFNGKMTWETKEKLDEYLWENKEDVNLMDEIHTKLTCMIQNIDMVHHINF